MLEVMLISVSIVFACISFVRMKLYKWALADEKARADAYESSLKQMKTYALTLHKRLNETTSHARVD